MEFAGCGRDELYTKEESSRRAKIGRRRVENDKKEYKSKNLVAERNRRQKLSDSLLSLRSTVPIITNMTRASIVEDAITYIRQLEMNVKGLRDELLGMEPLPEKETLISSGSSDVVKEKNLEIQDEVRVCELDGNAVWMKMTLEKRRGRFTRLIEAMTRLGFELTDTNVTTAGETIIVSARVQAIIGDTMDVQQKKEVLQEIIQNI
ncbi:hypothetical protein K2173_004578 [Erythroxylum novogranatense]|uniref:BHLH domain-containing protein n=1 Tax=Erythroxylum novogranatense TaxID=1862640 RepID=A0AAV8T4S2_9ROSI|nr:hypothetical protein K2173_004578 [Erythroxylum novogranatense]